MSALAPDVDLIQAVFAVLKADARLAGLVGDRIYDRPPEKAAGKPDVASPYVSLGPTDDLDASADCVDGIEISLQLDVWSWGSGDAYGTAECRTIAERLRRVLHDAELVLTDNALVAIAYERKRILRDPDGVTNHAVVQFTATIETGS